MTRAPVSDAHKGAVLALLSMAGMGPHRLAVLVDRIGDPCAVLDALAGNEVPDDVDLRAGTTRSALLTDWRTVARRSEPFAELERHRGAGVTVLAPGEPYWPTRLDDDPQPPPLLFVAGDPALLLDAGVSVVGTRRCSAAGTKVATMLGAGLADRGLATISGLALGIDGAAHRGTLQAGGVAVGVVASGLDVPYPPRHRDLWDQVRTHGVLVSESPLGVAPERWRFPARNRLIAALGLAVVVVESKRRGGSMLTADEALERGVPVLAVPGSVLSPVAAGPNHLLVEGATPVRDVDDVVGALGIVARMPSARGSDAGGVDASVAASPLFRALVAASAPCSLEDLAASLALSVDDAASGLTRLELAGAVRRVGGAYEALRP